MIIAANLDHLRSPRDTSDAPRGRLARLLICVGGILLIGGWGGQMLWGWQDSEVIAWPDEEIVLPEHELTCPQPSGPIGLAPGRLGLYVLSRGERVGLEVEVTDIDGHRLQLLPSVKEATQETLRLAFTTRDPEAFFAVPEADLILRLNQIEETIQIQAYRSASGDLLAETQLQRTDTDAKLEVDDVVASLMLTPLPRYEVIYNPGAVAEAMGVLLLALGGFMLQSPQETAPADREEPQQLGDEAR